jgi:hypothetical protein
MLVSVDNVKEAFSLKALEVLAIALLETSLAYHPDSFINL